MAAAAAKYARDKDFIPILDAIDCGRYKQGLTLCNKSIKKNAGTLNLLAAKAYCLDRLGHEDEAMELCATVAKEKPIDDTTLQLLSNVYRLQSQHALIVGLYEPAVEAAPANEEFANHLFMAHVRTKNFKGIQLLASKMQKRFKSNSNKYYFWVVMAIFLQA
ncbi:hypothetical protein HK405_009258 [Cladochytrium tenue]|nr:hypothetical protein HK405_009258 [Cladochytrium tenue]